MEIQKNSARPTVCSLRGLIDTDHPFPGLSHIALSSIFLADMAQAFPPKFPPALLGLAKATADSISDQAGLKTGEGD
jgi:hypothetical protein